MASPVFETTWSFAVQNIIKAAITLFLNGFCVLLVIFAIYFLCHRAPAGYRVHICALAVMLVLATIQMALQVVTATLSMKSLHLVVQDDGTMYSSQQDSLQRMSRILHFLELLLLVTNIIVVDGLLIYRCYVIWGTSYYKKKVVILPLLLLIALIALGSVTVYRDNLGPPESHLDPRIVFGLIFMTNLLVTGLTVGRIWWIRRNLGIVGQTKFIRRYNIAMAMLVESSALYLIGISTLLAVFSMPGDTGIWVGVGGQLGNIVPALLIVQVSLSRQVDTESVAAQSRLSSV
ncbi:hypothetical protein DFH09DRAFT_1360052 [Mycena vulgaris]|nr:hypothetical protein DFH09DRAFT_1360052 [Mycena vulgaris]